MLLVRKLFLMVSIIFLFSSLAMAQGKWQWPEHPRNIKALPDSISAEQLRSVMRQYSGSLGVRCVHCHKGEEGKPFSEWDFASDENPNKQRAREMIRMMNDINLHLTRIEPSGDQRVAANCFTCHRGRPRPLTLEAEIDEAYRKDGLEAAIAHLSRLKDEYYGKGIYNFESDDALDNFGNSLMKSGKTEEALHIFKLNVEKFPGSSTAWTSQAEGLLKAGNKPESVRSLEKAIELEPRNRRAQEMLQEVKP